MKTLKLIILCLTFFCINAKAQFGYGKIEEIEQVQKRKLIVVIEEPREKILNKLTKRKKEDEKKNYLAALDEYNANMKIAVEKYWPYHNGFEYMTYNQVKDLQKKSGNTDYAVIYCISQSPSTMGAGYVSRDGLNWSWDMKEDSEDRDYLDYFTTILVNRIEDMDKTPVYSNPLPDIFPNKADIIFGINNTKTYFDYRIRTKKNGEKINQQKMMEQQIADNAPRLKNMTLFLRSDWLNKELQNDKIKEYYPYQYKVCPSSEIDDAIINQKENIAYVLILPYVVSSSRSNMVIYMHYIYDAKTCDMMAYIRPSMGSMMGASYSGKAGKRTIEHKNLEKFTDMINGKD